MTPSDELRTKLRNLIDERIPPDGTEDDTRFKNTELDEILTEANNINQAAAEGWTRKALRAMSERGGLQESQAGNEKLKFVDLVEYKKHCLEMAQMFEQRGGKGTRLFAFDPPDVLGVGTS